MGFYIVVSIMVVMLIIASIMFIRNNLVYSIRGKAIKHIYNQSNWRELRKCLDNPSYGRMVWQLNKWTYKQFYPGFYYESSIKKPDSHFLGV